MRNDRYAIPAFIRFAGDGDTEWSWVMIALIVLLYVVGGWRPDGLVSAIGLIPGVALTAMVAIGPNRTGSGG